MRDLRIEITDKGTALYLATDPDGVWAKTTRPDDLVTIDWDAQGRVIGIEAIGSAARGAISAVVGALKQLPASDPESLHAALAAVTGEANDVWPDELDSFTELVTSVEPVALHHAIDGLLSNEVDMSFDTFRTLALECNTPARPGATAVAATDGAE